MTALGKLVAVCFTEIERRVELAPAEQIDTWAERVLSATTLAELLAS